MMGAGAETEGLTGAGAAGLTGGGDSRADSDSSWGATSPTRVGLSSAGD